MPPSARLGLYTGQERAPNADVLFASIQTQRGVRRKFARVLGVEAPKSAAENLAYRCDLRAGIARELLCPFHYYGVPDVVDYRNIPWRNGRFDPDALEAALAVRARADNALAQYRRHGGTRTLAFCCSQRHADLLAHRRRRPSANSPLLGSTASLRPPLRCSLAGQPSPLLRAAAPSI